jgi:hypothetical protein
MLVLQNNEEHNYLLSLQTKEKEKASMRQLHIKFVVSNYCNSILQRVSKNILQR